MPLQKQPTYSWRENSYSRRPLARDYLGTTTTKAVSTTAPAVCYGASNESDDLQAMVHDFIENDSLEFLDGIDSDGPSPGKKLIETLQMRTATMNSLERELLAEVKLRLLSIKEDTDLICEGPDCKGACVKRFVVKHLKVAGFDAVVCSSKWLSSGRVPGGEYEYIEAEGLIVDVDFQAQFEIARPTQQYEAALKILPPVFVGSASKLKKILEFMSEAAKVSLKQNHMHLPPWRTLDYMSSKWLSTKKVDAKGALIAQSMLAKQCREQLRLTKVALVAATSSIPSNLTRGRPLRTVC